MQGLCLIQGVVVKPLYFILHHQFDEYHWTAGFSSRNYQTLAMRSLVDTNELPLRRGNCCEKKQQRVAYIDYKSQRGGGVMTVRKGVGAYMMIFLR